VIVDTSALLAVVFQEAGFEGILERMEEASALAAGTPTLAVTGMILHDRLGGRANGLLERIVDELEIQEIPFTESHWREAVEAYRRYGRGRHPAALDAGDCLTYAVGRVAGEAILFTSETRSGAPERDS
jgi:ribonuclease VapC